MRPWSPFPFAIEGDARVAHCHFAGRGSDGEDATITFREPVYATRCTVRVRFAFPWAYFALACTCGGFAALLVRSRDLAAMAWWRPAIEVVLGAAVAAAVYRVLLSSGFRSLTGARLGLDVMTPVLTGLAGGLLGLILSNLAVGAFNKYLAEFCAEHYGFGAPRPARH